MSENQADPSVRSGRDHRWDGHVPGHLREAFEEWVYDMEPLDGNGSLGQQVVMHNGHMRTLDWLIMRLWKCMDIMPSFLCEQLALPSGSTYADGVRLVRPLLKA